MSDQPQQEDGTETSFQRRLAEAMTAEVRVRIPDINAAGGYREEWWSMERVYDVAWAAAADLSRATSDHLHNSTDE